ncbi:MAG: SpoIID/LytB domain-containing protein [Caldilineaceae bacterium]|nr:SpoIID/LytB domain-containing protein [Caldilineaceae bacterium]
MGLLWPSLLGGLWFFVLSEFGNPLAANAVNLRTTGSDPADTGEVVSEAVGSPGFTVEGSITHAHVLIGGTVVVDQEQAHLGAMQVDPSGAIVAFDIAPTGTETAALGQVHVYNMESGAEVASFPGYAPAWNETYGLTYVTPDHQAAAYNLETQATSVISAEPNLHVGESTFFDASSDEVTAQTTAPWSFHPKTIRVRHLSQNYCRKNVADNQIVEIPFEEYVARVLPAEVPPSWDMEALKAQAVAARTYAWNKIWQNRNNRNPFDISDWINNQVMCDYRTARTDQAAEETAGIILSVQGDARVLPLTAMYSAENGHPTRENTYVNYLKSIPDPNAVGKVRRGHGWGLSQLGAQRLAKQGLTYCQILGHYYQNIHINNFSDPDTPMGCLMANGGSGYARGSGLHLRALTSAGASTLRVVVSDVTEVSDPAPGNVAQTDDAPVDESTLPVVPDNNPEPDASTPLQALPDNTADDNPADEVLAATSAETPVAAEGEFQAGTEWTVEVSEAAVLDSSAPVTTPTTASNLEVLPLTISLPTDIRVWMFPSDVVSGTELELKLYSGETLLDTQLVTVDHLGPDWVELRVGAGNGATLPITVSATPGDGVSLGRDWTWEQSAFAYTTGSGAIFQEPGATDGLLWYAQPVTHDVGVWHGPYTGTLPAGRSYRAVFRLRVPDLERPYLKEAGPAELVAKLDVVHDEGTKTAGFRNLYVSDLRSRPGFQAFSVDFHLFEAETDVEFRVHWHDVVSLGLDQVMVVSLPYRNWQAQPLQWPRVPDAPLQNLQILPFDAADNPGTLFTLDLSGSTSSSGAGLTDTDCSLYGDCDPDPEANFIDVPTSVE